MTIIDITWPLTESLAPWPGRPPLILKTETTASDAGDHVHNSELAMDTHLGTHFDAKGHVGPATGSIDPPSLESCVGPCSVITTEAISITAETLARLIPPGSLRVLIRTSKKPHYPANPADPEAPGLTLSAAEWLVAQKVALIGIDRPSIQCRDAPDAVHSTLHRAGIEILEGLRLHHVDPGQYKLVALPLNIPGSDGLPARAILEQL